MLVIAFLAILMMVAWKSFVFGMKLTWGIARIACMVLGPLFLLCVIALGVFYMALPILIFIGICVLIGKLIFSS